MNKRKYFFIILAIAIISVSVAYFMGRPQSPERIIRGGLILELEAPGQNKYAVQKNNLIITSTTKTFAINQNGKILWEHPTFCANPKLMVAGDYVLVADLSGKNFYVIKGKVLLADKKLENSIFNAQINKKGSVTVSYAYGGFASRVSVFSRNGEEIYFWGLADEFAIDVAISPNNRTLACALYGEKSGEITSGIGFVDIMKREILEKPTFNNLAISNIEFNKSGDLLAIGHTATLLYTGKGEQIWANKYNGQVLANYALVENHGYALFFKHSSGMTQYNYFNFHNKLKYEEILDFNPKNISDNEEIILASGEMKIAKFKKNGGSAGKSKVEKEFLFQEVAKNDKFFYAVSVQGVEKIRTK